MCKPTLLTSLILKVAGKRDDKLLRYLEVQSEVPHLSFQLSYLMWDEGHVYLRRH